MTNGNWINYGKRVGKIECNEKIANVCLPKCEGLSRVCRANKSKRLCNLCTASDEFSGEIFLMYKKDITEVENGKRKPKHHRIQDNE